LRGGDRSAPRPEATDRSFGTTPLTTARTTRPEALRAPGAPGEGGRPPAIAAAGLSFTYRDAKTLRPAVRDVTLTVASGEFLALVGANGTGKSTLLRLIAGLLRPDAGTVTIDGRPVDGPDPRVGLVFQEPRLLPWRSTVDNIAFPLELAGWSRPRRQARAREMMGLVGLRGVDDVRPHQLSGGLRQRAGLARALALEPAVLLLDEPFSALDALTRERLNLRLQSIWHETGTSVVLVTHAISEAIFLADRVVVIAGRPGHLAAEVPIGLPRPRSLDHLDAADVSRAAALIREHLADDEEEGVA
jgi:NitT/TauT family transport system ATP-binding protein